METSPQSADAIVAEDVLIVMAAAKIIFFIIHSLLDHTVHRNSVTTKCADDQSNSPRIKIFFVFFRNGMVRVERIEQMGFDVRANLFYIHKSILKFLFLYFIVLFV